MTRPSTLLFLALATLMAFDSMVTTPIALTFIPHTIEANPFGAVGYHHFGLKFFFIQGICEIAILAVVIEGLDVLGERLNRANVIHRGENGRYNPVYRYGPLLAATLPGIAIMGLFLHRKEMLAALSLASAAENNSQTSPSSPIHKRSASFR